MKYQQYSFLFLHVVFLVIACYAPNTLVSQTSNDSIQYHYNAILNPKQPESLSSGMNFYNRKKITDLANHDTLAAIVDQQRSAEQRQLREVERRIELGYREHQESKQSKQLYFFDAGQLARIEPFLEKATLFPEWELFLADSKKEQHRLAEEKEAEQKSKKKKR